MNNFIFTNERMHENALIYSIQNNRNVYMILSQTYLVFSLNKNRIDFNLFVIR